MAKQKTKSVVVAPKRSNNKQKPMYRMRFMMTLFLSFVTLIIIAGVSATFIFLARDSFLRKTDETSQSIAAGISSAAIEAIVHDRDDMLNRYFENFGTVKIEGLISAYVAEYTFRVENGVRYPVYATAISGYQYGNVGERIAQSFFTNFLEVEDFRREEETISNRISGKEIDIFQYTYPIIYTVDASGAEERTLGVVRLRFDRNTMLRFYRRTFWFTIAITAVALLLVGRLALLSTNLTRRLEKTLGEVELLSVTDPLTQISNRKRFNSALDEEINRAQRYNKQFSIIMFDIDHFKKINDSHGHDVGDDVLVGVVEVVKSLIRDVDVFARWGGEEFMVLAPDTDRKGARQLASRIRARIEKEDFPNVAKVTCSFGVTSITDKDDLEMILKRADLALYNAKEDGRNTVRTL